ncbi:MAG: transposase [Proteobacteria bacterium]|nr:transposase [Pseudomonadota bacterium]
MHSQVLQDVLFRVERAFQGFFRRLKEKNGKAGYPRFKSENRYDSITYPQQPGFQLTEQGLKLSKIGTIKLKKHREIKGDIETCTIKKEIDRWYACFSVEYGPVKKLIPDKAIGIDMGIKSFATLSNGEIIDNPKYLRKSEERLITKQRQLSQKKKGCKNRKKARIKVAKLHCKVRNQRNDFHHKVSRKIVDTYGFIVVENLHIKGMVRNHHLAKSISDAGWRQFLNYLTYKAEEAGCLVEKVSPHYTSINCSVCGEPVPKTLAQRIHRCPFCKTVMDRDHNAAQNILLKSTAGTAGINAWGEAVYQCPSLNQEALSVRTG